MCAKDKSEENAAPSWWAPVFFRQPCSTSVETEQKTLVLNDPTSTEIQVYVLTDENSKLGHTGHAPAGFAVVNSRPCSMYQQTSGSEYLCRRRDEEIRVNVQNGTWCKAPMSASEAMEVEAAMQGVKYVCVSEKC